MDKVVDKNRLLESSRWRDFFQSVAVGLQVSITLLSDDGSLLMHTPEVCPNCGSTCVALTSEDMIKISNMCKTGLIKESIITYNGDTAILQKLRDKLYIVIRECSCISEFGYPGIDQRSDSAQKLLHSFLLSLCEEIAGGERAVELITLRQINHIVISMFHGKGETVELALDLILSALIILLDAKGCWVEYIKDNKTHLLIKGDKPLVENYLYQNIGHAIVEKIANSAVQGSIGVLLSENIVKASSLLPAMAQECMIAFEIEHLFQLMRAQLTNILGSIDSAIILFERNNKIFYANSTAGKLLDCDPIVLIGRRAESMSYPWIFAITEGVINHVSGMMDKLECSYRNKLVDWQVYPIYEGTQVTGRMVIVDDRTEYYKWLEIGKKAERMAAAAAMIGPLAHHLRNPLAAAKGLAQLMGLKKDPQKIMGYNDLIQRELDRVICLLNEFLMLGKPALQSSEPIDFKAFLVELIPILIEETSGTGIEITANMETVPSVLVDSGQLTQVVINLVRNSVEAINSGGVININLKAQDNWIKVIFEDNGPGIPEEIIGRIFEPFFTTKERGTGLGLSVAQAIVNNHGGHITASNSPIGGAIFTVMLPIVSYSPDMKHRLDVILVYKDDIIRNSIEQILHVDGIYAISVKDLVNAYNMDQYYYPQVLILDKSFVNSDSIKYIKKIWSNIRILVIGEVKELENMKVESISFPVEYFRFISKIRSMLY